MLAQYTDDEEASARLEALAVKKMLMTLHANARNAAMSIERFLWDEGGDRIVKAVYVQLLRFLGTEPGAMSAA